MTFLSQLFPPGLEPATSMDEWCAGSSLAVCRRRISPEAMATLVAGLRDRAEELRGVPVRVLIDALDSAHRDWSAVSSSRRDEAVALLHQATGFARETLDLAVRHLFASMDAARLDDCLRSADIHPDLLHETGGADPSGPMAVGPVLSAVIASGNVPVAAVPSVVHALLLRSPCLVKCSSQEPVLLPLYARSVAETCPELGAAMAVTGWDGGDRQVEAPLLAAAEAVVAYGADDTLADLRARLPLRTRFIGYGHRISLAAVGRESLSAAAAPETARRAAIDVSFFDQQGCLSPQAIYVERGGESSPEQWGELLAAALDELGEHWPRRRISAAESAAIHQYRAVVEIRAGIDVGLWQSRIGTGWTVALVPEPELQPCCLNRTAVIRPLATLEELPGHLRTWRRALSTAALEVSEERRPLLARLLAGAGVTRIARLGAAQQPANPLLHDGVNAMAGLVRLVGAEAS